MLSRIDEVIFPNRCEVLEFSNPQRFVYPIFKNGTSSMMIYPNEPNPKKLISHQIKQCDLIDVILRDPEERFVSGVNTFVYNLLRDVPSLDKNTIMYFVENYLFLNRHYAPQVSWLVNLNRFTKTECKLNLHNMSKLTEYTTTNHSPPEDKILTSEEIERLKNNTHNQIYKQIDEYLLMLIGESLTFKEIMDHIKSKDLAAFQKLKCIALD